MEFTFSTVTLKDAHPNTAVLRLSGEHGRKIEVQAASIGGGRILIAKLDGIEVNFTATLQLYRDKRGGYAVMVIETDQEVPEESVTWLEQLDGIIKVTYINVEE